MQSFSKEELSFNTKSITNGFRTDKRDFLQNREQQILKINCPQSDKAIKIIRGFSEVELKIGFKASCSTLQRIGALDEIAENVELISNKHKNEQIIEGSKIHNIELIFEEYKTIQSKFTQLNSVFERIENLLNEYEIGILIEVVVLKNDGNIFDMVFAGLNYIFNNLEIPDIKDLNNSLIVNVNLPISETFAIFSDFIISDPILIEEASADGVIHIFKENNTIINICSDSPIPYDLFLNFINRLNVNY